MADEYFTLVFKGSLREFKGNPLRTETPFGIPFVCAIGDLSEQVDLLEERLEASEESRPLDTLQACTCPQSNTQGPHQPGCPHFLVAGQ
jgi:hypothetical protein